VQDKEDRDQPELHLLRLVTEQEHGRTGAERPEKRQYEQGAFPDPPPVPLCPVLVQYKNNARDEVYDTVEREKRLKRGDPDQLPPAGSR
jgi:hypothetical protein